MTALVTGGASGIGRALAAALVARGEQVVIADLAHAEAAAAELGGRGPGAARGVRLDVTDAGAVTALVRELGRLDLVVLNAGVPAHGRAEQLTDTDWARTLAVNLDGVVHGVRAAYPVLLRQGHGHLVLMASLAGLVPAPLAAPYTASKHAVVGLGQALRAEAAEHGVRVTVVCPGFVNTPLLSGEVARHALRLQGSLCPPERIAEQVLRGLAANRGLLVLPGRARMYWRLHRFLPGISALLARRFAKS